MTDFAIKIENLSKKYLVPSSANAPSYQTIRESLAGFLNKSRTKQNYYDLWALKDINLIIKPGEKLGIVGPNGAGKTTLLKILSKITDPTQGQATIKGRVGSLLEVGSGFHPELTGRENIYLNGAILGMTRTEIKNKFVQIINFSEVGDLINMPVKHYSSGQYMRLAFSVAAFLDTEILLVDEVLSIGDLSFQNKCIGKINEISGQGRTILFVSHNLTTIRQTCELAILLNQGRIIFSGKVNETINRYLEISSESTGYRWVNQDAKEKKEIAYIDQIRILDVNDVPQKVFLNSNDIFIEFTIKVKKESPDFKVGFDLFYQDGLAFRTQNVDSYLKNRLKRGNNVLRCRIPGRLLNKGSYYLAPIFALHAIKTLRGPKPPVLEIIVDIDTNISPFHGLINPISQPGPVFPVLDWESVNHV